MTFSLVVVVFCFSYSRSTIGLDKVYLSIYPFRPGSRSLPRITLDRYFVSIQVDVKVKGRGLIHGLD